MPRRLARGRCRGLALAMVAVLAAGCSDGENGGDSEPRASAPARDDVGGAPSEGSGDVVLTGPVTGGNGTPTLVGTPVDFPQLGYVGAEYFLEGTAESYDPAAALEPDGTWEVTVNGSAP